MQQRRSLARNTARFHTPLSSPDHQSRPGCPRKHVRIARASDLGCVVFLSPLVCEAKRGLACLAFEHDLRALGYCTTIDMVSLPLLVCLLVLFVLFVCLFVCLMRCSAETAAPSGHITVSEVARHNNRDDCWVVIDGQVYDATKFVKEHPGGEILTTWAGADATDVFGAFHPDEAADMLSSMHVGPLAGGKSSSVAAEFRALKMKLSREGMFAASPGYYTYKVCFNLAMLAVTVLTCHTIRGYSGAFLGAFMIALFWQQCGWLSHDFLHHQVFVNRRYGDWMGLFLGNVLQGFSVSWWKAKHNTHHAVPNVMEGVRDGDPDINTMPFLAWSDAFIEGELVGLPRVMVRWQHLLFLPLLCIARTSWVVQSLLYVAYKPIDASFRRLEIATLALHYAYMIAICWTCFSLTESLVFFFVSQAFGGLLLGTVFTINHNSMAVLDSDAVRHTEFAAMQCLTTRNISSSLFMDWFTGGLNYQIEHHIYPSLPRHRFGKVAPLVKAICDKHGLPYITVGFVDGLRDVLNHLSVIAHKAK